MFYVGQKVECVGGRGPAITAAQVYYYKIKLPTLGSTYTISSIFVLNGQEGIRLEELDNKHVPTREGLGHELGFFAYCFRPIVERKTDISIFTDMLKPKHVEAQA